MAASWNGEAVRSVFAGLVLSIVLLLGTAITNDGIWSRPLQRPVWCLLLYRLMGAHGFSYEVSKGCGGGISCLPRPSGMMTSTTAMRPF